MFPDFYNNIILKKPKFVFLSLIILLIFFGYYSKDFRLDASSDTLLIEGDPDLEYLKEINEAKKSEPNSLRAKFGKDWIKNEFHGSDSPFDANKERDVFKFPIP